MPRISRVIAPGYPHHVTQRGNRRQQTFFSDDDYQTYVRLMSDWCGKCNVEIWAYCLMPNHVHLIAVPPDKTSMSPAIGEAHRRAHIAGKDDRLVTVRPLFDMVGREWSHFLSEEVSSAESEDLRKHEKTGRPIGKKSFVRRLETILNRKLLPGKPGRKLKLNK